MLTTLKEDLVDPMLVPQVHKTLEEILAEEALVQ